MKQQIHIDTASFNRLVTKTNGNPFNCVFKFGQTHRRVRCMRLLNAQIPVGFYNIRTPYNTLVIDSIVYTIPPGNYSSDSLLSIVNNIITPDIGVFAVYPALNKVYYVPANGGTSTISTTTPFTSYPAVSSGYFTNPTQPTLVQSGYPSSNYPNIATFLGFTGNPTGTYLTATNSYIFNFDTYIKISIANLGVSGFEPDVCSFKIPVDVPSGSVIQWAEYSKNRQEVTVTDSSCIVDRLVIQVYDRFDVQLDNNGLDWSFTLEIESDT